MNQQIEKRQSFGEQFHDFLHANATLLLAAGVALLLISDVFGTHGVLAMRRSQKQAADIEEKIEQLNQENAQLDVNVKALKTDPEAIEKIAREEMGLAKQGEYIFKVAPQTPATQSPSGDSGRPAAKP
ncbi:MAG TPA: septum formation initiator family protein [Candidatus Acidoferrales bacterium]